jgi:hypothetical protein
MRLRSEILAVLAALVLSSVGCAAATLEGSTTGGGEPGPARRAAADEPADGPADTGAPRTEPPPADEPRPPGEEGAVCEFDPECLRGLLCIGGRCQPDPRGLTCSTTADCPVGFSCTAGACTPTGADGCGADDECPEGSLCEGGMCIGEAACDIRHPDLAGAWEMDSVLRLREALPDWLGDFMTIVAGPFHYIAGHTMELDLGLPGWVESIIGPVIRRWAEDNLPPWTIDLLGGIADLSDILSTWTVHETMHLEPGAEPDVYRGSHVWNEVEFTYRGRPLRGAPADIMDWHFVPSDFDAAAVCGVFSIQRHDVDVNIGAIIAWLVDAIVQETSGGRWRTLDAALTELTRGFCRGAGDAAQAAISWPGVALAVESACNNELGNQADRLTAAIRDARLGLDVMTLKGTAPIAGPRSLRPGVWEGTLAGGDFGGDFSAVR